MKTIRIIAWVACALLASLMQAQVTEQVTAVQYYYDTDPGPGFPGNGAIIPVTPSADLNQSFSISLPGTLSSGFHRLYIRVRDEHGRWSVAELRMFFIETLPALTVQITAYQFFFDTDPGVDVPGNGSIVPVTPTADLNQSIAIPLSGTLADGFHRLYIRVKDEHGRWSAIERRFFYIKSDFEITDQIVAYQYYLDTDPGVSVPGNGAIVPVSPTDDLDQTIAIPLTGPLTGGFHRLYIRVKDEHGRWSVIERRFFYIKSDMDLTEQIVAYQYFLDTDPGVSLPGNGTIVPVSPSDDLDQTIAIPLGTLTDGFHRLYIRVKDEHGRWSQIERRMFYIQNMLQKTENIVQLEYFFDADPGAGNANPYPATPTGDYQETIDLGVPCLATGTHYFYLRARDNHGRWSIIERDTLEITSGIAESLVTPTGPLSLCTGDEIELSTIPVPGVTYQWVKDGDPVSGETSSTLTVTEGGDYALQAHCGSSFVLSNTVMVSELPLITYYADMDSDGYGDSEITLLDCELPPGYVTNDDDCDDTNMNIHPTAAESCNLLDDDCDGMVDEGVQSIFYVDTDEDGFGDPLISVFACTVPVGYVANDDDCDDENAMLNPNATEICNLIDDDCDGNVDEGVLLTFYADADNDGYGDLFVTVQGCTPPPGFISDNTDCNDADQSIHPGALEECNGLDDNCDGVLDEGFVYSLAPVSVSSSNGSTFCAGGSTLLSLNGGTLGTGAEWVWYEGGCGNGSSIGVGTSLEVNPADGSHTYYVRAEGDCGVSFCASLTIMVQTAPGLLTCPANLVAGNSFNQCNAIVNYIATFNGNPSPDINYDLTGVTSGSGPGTGSGSVFDLGETSVTIMADNVCGTASCAFDVTINDTQVPVITNCPMPVNSVVESGQWGAHVSWTPPTIMDNCSLASFTSSHAPGSFFNVGTTTITYTAEDESGNTSVCQFYVTVTPPVIQPVVNLSVFVSDIMFSNSNPDPGESVNVIVSIHNTSVVNAADFEVQLEDLFSNISYPSITVPALSGGQSTQVNWVITMPAVAAFIPISVKIDAFDELIESSEADNVAVKSLICGEPASLGTLGVGTNPVPATVPAGSTIQLCGSAFYENVVPPLSDPSVAGAEITITIVETGNVISGYTDENGNFCVSYLTPNTPGIYHYTVEVTDHTIGGDASGTFELSTPPPPPCLKDLRVSINLTGIPEVYYSLPVGTSFSGFVQVHNACQSVSESTTLFLSFTSGIPVPGPFVIPALGPGETYQVALPAMSLTSIGSGYLSATVDYNNIVAEANETNNTAYKFFDVLPLLSDLAVIGGEVLSDAFCQSGNQVAFTIKNYGYSPSGSYTVVFDFYENELLQATETRVLPTLLPDKDTVVLFSFTPSVLLDSFVLRVDHPDVIDELNELNNLLQFTYRFKPCQPDLQLLGCEYFDVKPAGILAFENMQISAMIKNSGQLPVTTPFDVEFNIGGDLVTVPVNSSLAPGQIISVMASGVAPAAPGENISATADAGNVVTEAGESNNSYSAALCYDFEFTNLDCKGEPIFSGTQYYCNSGVFRVGLWNFGVFEADELQVKFEINGPGLGGWVTLGTVTKYMGNSCDCPDGVELPNTFYFPQTGLFDVRITLDPNNDYMECNESNNLFLATINVLESSDYKVLSTNISPSNLNPDIDEVVSFAVTYTNDGCTGFNQIELHTTIDEVPLDSLMVSPLSSGGFNTVAISKTWSSSVPGMHVFRATIDHDEQIGEVNELNNEATKAIIVGEAPDYHVMTFTASDISPDFGQLITLSTDVHNDGQSTGSGLLQFFYVDPQNSEVLIDQQSIAIIPGTTESRSIFWVAIAPYAKLMVRVINVIPLESDYTDNQLELQLRLMSLMVTVDDVDCAGLDLGSLEVEIDGGQAPYSIQWSSGQTDALIQVPSGTYSVVVTDLLGTTVMAFDTVMDLALPVTWYADLDGDGKGNPDNSVIACIAPSGYVGSGTDCNDSNATVYPDAPELPDGLDNDCDGAVDEGLSTLSVEAGECEVVFLGYEPAECYVLAVNTSGGTVPLTYAWSNGATTPTSSVCPEVTTIYSVTVTDANGFSAQDNVTVQVIDIRCGNNNNKVLVCHLPPGNEENMQMICISSSAVQAHLDHGCYVGICEATDPCQDQEEYYSTNQTNPNLKQENHMLMQTHQFLEKQDDDLLTIYPNPADDFIEFQIPASATSYHVLLYDASGMLIKAAVIEKGNQQISTSELASGVYFLEITNDTERMVTNISVLH